MVTNNVTMMKQQQQQNSSSAVPAFLSKLWTLVEDEETNGLICWSQEGNSFLVLDEQRFAKDILPKFFKHSNMASFIRQLNMYGFRKVMSCDSGHMVKQERDGPVEFQHPFFKHGQDDLLEHIKRKVSSTRPGEDRRQEDLTRLLTSVQNVHGRQEAVDARLTSMKRENEALWREISDLRQKHAHQQQLIKKLIHFIVTLVQNNHILNLKRKRPILMNSNGKKSKFIHQIYEDQITDDVIICDVTQGEEPGGVADDIMESTLRVLEEGEVEVLEVGLEEVEAEDMDAPSQPPEDLERRALECSSSLQQISKPSSSSSSALQQISKPSGGLVAEDPFKMMESIMNESAAISQNISLLGKVELMDYLDSIDCSLEDFQAMLFCKPFTDEDFVVSKDGSEQLTRDRLDTEDNTDKQLIQYTHCPLLAFLDAGSSSMLEPPQTSCSTVPSSDDMLLLHSSCQAPPSELLEEEEEEPSAAPRSSALVRLEPLSEAEASQDTLFHLVALDEQQHPLEDTL